MKTRVAIAKCSHYDLELVIESIEEIIANTDFPDCSGKKVLLKPNILSDSKVETGITTNPVVVEALVIILQKKNASEIYIGDSPGLHTASFDARNCGIRDVCNRTGAIWVDFTAEPREHIIDKGKYLMAGILDEVDVVISVAKFKTHQLMYATGCVKNMFGTLPGLNKSRCHARKPSRQGFAELITGIYRETRCCYGLMDAIIGMEGPGPANGNIRKVGYLIGSSDSYLVDLAQATIMGYEQKDIPILAMGKARNETDLDPVYPLLVPEELVIQDYRKVAIGKEKAVVALLMSTLKKPFHRYYINKRPLPSFNNEKCVRCRRCIDICPAQALSLEDEKISLKKDKCVRCYCCHEMCPKDAIKIV